MKENLNKIKSNFSIKDLENLSGVKAHTIRVWEKRYGIFNPDRTQSNIRNYGLTELKRLLNIAVLINNGVKISKIAQYEDEEMTKEVDAFVRRSTKEVAYWSKLVYASIEYNEIAFTNILREITEIHGFINGFVKEVVPFLIKLGTAWQIGAIKPSNEHFAINLVRQKIYSELNKIEPVKEVGNSKLFVLFLPLNEIHEIGLLFYSLVLKSWGVKCIYLGQSVPVEDLASFKGVFGPKVFVTSFTIQPTLSEVPKYMESLLAQVGEEDEIWLSGRNSSILENHNQYRVFNNMEDIMTAAKIYKK